MTDVSLGVRAKRKRGRPRKDSNLSRDGTLPSPENSSFMKTQGGAELLYPSPADANKKPQQDCSDDGMVGSMVYGVVEGSFDAGYLISVRIGNNLTPFRGVIFQPRKVVAVTPANDVAPQAKMYQRREVQVQVPAYDNTNNNSSNNNANLATKQPVVRPLIPHNVAPYSHTGSSSNIEGKIASQHFNYGSLRMVEEDQVMQAFEVSISSNLATNGEVKGTNTTFPSKGSLNQEPESIPSASNLQLHHNPMESPFEIQQEQIICRETIDHLQEMTRTQTQTHSPQPIKTDLQQPNLYYNESSRTQDVNFHENLFSRGDSREAEGEQQPQKMTAEVQQANQMFPSMGSYHQALVSGNPLLVPPDLMGEPLDFMMERPKTPTNCKNSDENNLEVQSRLVSGGERFHGVGIDPNHAMANAETASPYKLELATPQSGLNTRISDMDFVLANAHQITPTDDNS